MCQYTGHSHTVVPLRRSGELQLTQTEIVGGDARDNCVLLV